MSVGYYGSNGRITILTNYYPFISVVEGQEDRLDYRLSTICSCHGARDEWPCASLADEGLQLVGSHFNNLGRHSIVVVASLQLGHVLFKYYRINKS